MEQSGGVDLVKIMHEGYPHRVKFDFLQDRYQSNLPEFKDEEPRLFIEALMIAYGIDENKEDGRVY